MRYRPNLDLCLKDISVKIVSFILYVMSVIGKIYMISRKGEKRLEFVVELGQGNHRYV